MSEGARQGLWPVVGRELRRATSRWIYAMLTLVLPLSGFAVFAAIFWASVPTNLPVVVSDRDLSATSRMLVRLIDAAPALAVAGRVPDAETGRRAIVRGSAYAVVLIPAHFERDLLGARRPEVVAYYNNQYLLPGGLINRDLTSVISTVSAGANARARQLRGESPASARAHVQPVYVDTHVLFNPYMSYLYYLVPALLPNLLQIFVTVVTVFAVGIELKEGTAGEWLERAGGKAWKAALGKLLPYTVVFAVVAVFMNAFTYGFLDVPVAGSLGLIQASTLLMVAAYQGVGLLMVAVAGNLRIATSMAALYAAPAFAFIGVTFPIYAMPLAGRLWASILPLTYHLQIVGEQALRGAPPAVSLGPLKVLALFAAAAPLLALPRLKRLLRDPGHWGRL